jgi:hypothetical protein
MSRPTDAYSVSPVYEVQYGDGSDLLRVNLRLNVATDCCLSIKARSPRRPPKHKGGTGIFCFVPILKGDARGSETQLKARFIKGFSLTLTRRRAVPCPDGN